MPQTDEAAAWFGAVYNAVQEVPYGKVTSYGHIARLLGKRKSSYKYSRRKVATDIRHSPVPKASRREDKIHQCQTDDR